MDVRFLAFRLHGDGTEAFAGVLPLTGHRIHRALSGPGGIDGTVPEAVALPPGPDGRPVLYPAATAIYAELRGQIMAGALLYPDSVHTKDAEVQLSTRGFSSFLDHRHYPVVDQWVEVDPADLVRHAWATAQAQPRADLGVVVDPTTTPVRVGEEEREVEFETGGGEVVEFIAGPFKWNFWSTHDLGSEVDKLCQDTPIEYLEEHSWAGEQVAHRIMLGHPRLGTRRPDLRFVVGENITEPLDLTGGAWTDHVTVLGAGEGRDMRRGEASLTSHDRVHSPVVVVDKSLRSNRECQSAAASELAWRSGGDQLAQVAVVDHPSAPLGSWRPGDEIYVQGPREGLTSHWRGWVRVVADELLPETDSAVLTVQPVGRGQS